MLLPPPADAASGCVALRLGSRRPFNVGDRRRARSDAVAARPERRAGRASSPLDLQAGELPLANAGHVLGDELAILVHGRAELIAFGEEGFPELDHAFVGVYGGTASTEDEGSVYVRVDPARMFTFARRPERFGA